MSELTKEPAPCPLPIAHRLRSHFSDLGTRPLKRFVFSSYVQFFGKRADSMSGTGRQDRGAGRLAQGSRRRRRALHPQGHPHPADDDRRQDRSRRPATATPGLDAIRTVAPDIVLVDWEMPGLDGPGFVRAVRSPDTFPYPDVPIIMLTGHGERSRVIEAARLGIHEYLLKPVSSQALQARIALGHHPSAPDGAARRLLRSRAAQAVDLQARGRSRPAPRTRHWWADLGP